MNDLVKKKKKKEEKGQGWCTGMHSTLEAEAGGSGV
jgi:hypothetical protein